MFYLENLQLNGFRNYRKLKVQFHPRINLIYGDNAQGKTNLLEAIYYLAVNSSFRTRKECDLINADEEHLFLKGFFINNDLRNTVQASLDRRGRLKLQVNENRANRYDYLRLLPIVVFSPDDIQIIKEGPATRRSFINLEASRLHHFYLSDLKAYRRTLLQRNHLLKSNYGKLTKNSLLEEWDRSLVALGSSIIHARVGLIEELEGEAEKFFERMTGSLEKLSLQYVSTVQYSSDLQETASNFERSLLKNRDREIARGLTTLGPHLDDMRININGFDARRFSSQGQKRTAALALKMAEISLFIGRGIDAPIILLDDVFSEFDQIRKRHLLQFLSGNAGQCFITMATGFEDFENLISNEHRLFSVSRGCVFDETVRAGN